MSRQKTINIRIPVYVDSEAKWCSEGGSDYQRTEDIAHDTYQWALERRMPYAVLYWIEADVPVPDPHEPIMVQGSVKTTSEET